MQETLKDKNDIKIFILYLLMNINYPLVFSDINDIVVTDAIVGCIDFAECFFELVETGNIVQSGFTKSDEGNEPLYEISEQGRKVAETLKSSIVGYIRTRSLKSALRLLSFKRSGALVSSVSSKREDGRFDVDLFIREQGEQILTMRVIVDNENMLERIRYNFDSKPEMIYRSILALLAGEANYLLDDNYSGI